MDAQNEDPATELKHHHSSRSASLLRTLFSLALFIAVDFMIFRSWSAVILLVSVIFIHELGHYTAMKIFGYTGINMTFVPFLGAYVSGEAAHFSKYKKIIMLLAGPVPGIVIGMIILLFYQQNLKEHFYLASLAFLVLNVFNLLPVSPLDGGQIIETMFFGSNLAIQAIFLMLSMIVMVYLVYAFKIWFLLIIAFLITRRIFSLRLVYKVRKELHKRGIPYDCSYEELTHEHYALIRDVLITKSSVLSRKFTPGEHSVVEDRLISYIEKILLPPYTFELTGKQKTLLLSTYLLAFILPALQWGFVKGWFD